MRIVDIPKQWLQSFPDPTLHTHSLYTSPGPVVTWSHGRQQALTKE